jgi:hypothetical protein
VLRGERETFGDTTYPGGGAWLVYTAFGRHGVSVGQRHKERDITSFKREMMSEEPEQVREAETDEISAPVGNDEVLVL